MQLALFWSQVRREPGGSQVGVVDVPSLRAGDVSYPQASAAVDKMRRRAARHLASARLREGEALGEPGLEPEWGLLCADGAIYQVRDEAAANDALGAADVIGCGPHRVVQRRWAVVQ